MTLAFCTGKYLFDVVETSDEARAQVEPLGTKSFRATLGLLERIEARSQNVVDHVLERHPSLPPLPFEPCRHIVIDCQRGPHIVMLYL